MTTEEVNKEEITINRKRFMELLDEHLMKSGTKWTVNRYNEFLVDLGFNLSDDIIEHLKKQ